jgi:hypothetical protein
VDDVLHDVFEFDDDCDCIIAVKKGMAVLLTVHDGLLRETVCPQLLIAQAHQGRANTRS